MLPNKALPCNGLHSIASAVAASQSKAGSHASRLGTGQKTAEVPCRESCAPQSGKPPSVIASVAGAAGLTGNACATAKGVVPPIKAGSATAKGKVPPIKAGSGTAKGLSTAVGTGVAFARHSMATAKSASVKAKTSNGAAQRAVTTNVQAASAAAPQSKAEEARQMALALSASLGEGNASLPSAVFCSCLVCLCRCC